jgi:hypothetical protein
MVSYRVDQQWGHEPFLVESQSCQQLLDFMVLSPTAFQPALHYTIFSHLNFTASPRDVI